VRAELRIAIKLVLREVWGAIAKNVFSIVEDYV